MHRPSRRAAGAGASIVGTRENGTPPYEGTPGKNPGAESFAARSVASARASGESARNASAFANAASRKRPRTRSPGVRATRVPNAPHPSRVHSTGSVVASSSESPVSARGSASSADETVARLARAPTRRRCLPFRRPTSPPDSTRWRRGRRRRASRPRKGPSRARRRIPARGGTAAVAGVRRTRTSRAGRSGVAPSAKTRVSGEMCARRMDAMRSEMSAGVTGLTRKHRRLPSVFPAAANGQCLRNASTSPAGGARFRGVTFFHRSVIRYALDAPCPPRVPLVLFFLPRGDANSAARARSRWRCRLRSALVASRLSPARATGGTRHERDAHVPRIVPLPLHHQ